MNESSSSSTTSTEPKRSLLKRGRTTTRSSSRPNASRGGGWARQVVRSCSLICLGWGFGCITLGPFFAMYNNFSPSSSNELFVIHGLEQTTATTTTTQQLDSVKKFFLEQDWHLPAHLTEDIVTKSTDHNITQQPEKNAFNAPPEEETVLHVPKKQGANYPLSNHYVHATSPFAYAFVVGGCDPENNVPSYQNYLFNIIVATRVLRERGSQADVVALFQIASRVSKNHTRLPWQHVRLLHELGIYVYYIPQHHLGVESFYRTQLFKFSILGLTEYKRILFMDADIMPLANLDYLFVSSIKGELRENVLIQGTYEPANGGFFMVEPGPLKKVNSIIQRREESARRLPYPYFNETIGWGDQPSLNPDDPWIGTKENGTKWNFLAAIADQGLLYYYTKYVQKSVSIIGRDNGKVEHWVANANSTSSSSSSSSPLLLVKSTSNVDELFQKAHKESNLLDIPGRFNRAGTPMNSFVHFTGRSKPWLAGWPEQDLKDPNKRAKNMHKSARHYWFGKLMELNEEFDIGLDFATHWSNNRAAQRPALGLYPVNEAALTAMTNIVTPLQREFPPSRRRTVNDTRRSL